MQKDAAEKLVHELKEKEKKTAHGFLVTLIAIILALYLLLSFIPGLEHLFPDLKPFWQHAEEILHDILIAAQVSLVVFFLEHRMREGRLQQITTSVWLATLESLVPEELANEMIMIIKEPVYREGLYYDITFIEPNHPGEFLILRREITYNLKNSTDLEQPYEIKTATDMKFPDVPVSPSIVEINGVREENTATNKNFLRANNETRFAKEITIPARGKVRVFLQTDEVIRLSELNNRYNILHPSVGLRLKLHNSYNKKIENPTAILIHRSGIAFHGSYETGYSFNGGLLPGQGFEVTWELK